MQISAGKVVFIDYTLKDDDGEVIDSSAGGEPLAFVQGAGQIVPGLEAALEGRRAGEEFSVVVPPAEGYGFASDELIAVVSADEIEDAPQLEVGMELVTETDDGEERSALVTRIEGNEVTVDANHPLAGLTLHFDIAVRGVRDATPEELAHGHAHDGTEDH